ILKVHTSNYTVQGFTASVPEAELGALARERGVPFMVDLGAGALVDLSRWGLPKEPTPQQSLAWGASVVTFSGDQLLGGPAAGRQPDRLGGAAGGIPAFGVPGGEAGGARAQRGALPQGRGSGAAQAAHAGHRARRRRRAAPGPALPAGRGGLRRAAGQAAGRA